jgi:hypothetical protein
MGSHRLQEWGLDLDVRLGSLDPAAIYDLVTVEDGAGRELARISLAGRGAVQLAAPQGAVAAALGIDRQGACHLHVRRDPLRSSLAVELSAGGAPPARLAVTLAAGAPPPARLLLGRNRRGHTSFPLWSSTFSDLWLLAGAS